MLKTRVLTALVLLAVFIPAALYLPDIGWAILMSLVVGIAAWEWAGLAGFGKKGRLLYGIGLFAVLAACWLFGMEGRIGYSFSMIQAVAPVLAVSVVPLVFWVVLVPLWFHCRWSLTGGTGLVVGLLVLLPAWLVTAAPGGDKGVLFAIMVVAWVADIAAYFTGRQFGKHKLAPSISPGKTWEGAAGALAGVFLYLACVWNLIAPESAWTRASELQSHDNMLVLPCVAFLLTAACILGDLFESLLKRQAGVKDSGNLLPGHGGVLDRIDSLLALLAVWFPVILLGELLNY
ncbi:MAG: phosphatidate cytidylyltransferase [Zoogloeaceae bacterium]|jgi:phosphatidate cytidylyltransferase|nr:phosphatidate cytidylyltransferase [Zoogloeaceae bacterium]